MSFQYRCKSCDNFVSGDEDGGTVIRAINCKSCDDKFAGASNATPIQELVAKLMNFAQAITLLRMGYKVKRKHWHFHLLLSEDKRKILKVENLKAEGQRKTEYMAWSEDLLGNDWEVLC